MKKRLLIPLSLLAISLLAGCSSNNKTTNIINGSDYGYNEQVSINELEEIEVNENNNEFEISTNDGEYVNY